MGACAVCGCVGSAGGDTAAFCITGDSLGIGSEATGGAGGAGCASTEGVTTVAGGGEGGGALGFMGGWIVGELCTVGDTVDDAAISRLVVRATDTVIGGGTAEAAGLMVTWAVGVAGGTNVICGWRAGACAGGGACGSAGGLGFRPCSSSFLSSNVAMSVLMKDRLCFVSWAFPTRSL